ncbi:maleate cis-trans isomerase family protein [Roseovarius salinarum]|uniref:maleate cis-trans isomerase family protein n=1 Tax=Roseovarius salinarum TaxID=1981892 RepID=UPI000C31FDCC|nr:aspartate/glutamate racemase family protein [Roseovarius salinarum]
MDYRLDNGAGGGRRLGLIVLSTDETLEYEARQVVAGGDVNLLHARIPMQADVTPRTLETMAASMTETAGRLPAGLDAVAYGCTSGATVIGPGRVAALVQAAQPGVPVTDPMSAVLAALDTLGARRIALVTPYLPEVSAPMRDHMGRHGVSFASEISFGQGDDWTVTRIAEDSSRAAMLEAGRAAGVEAVFASCTNLRSFGVIEAVEAELGVPVVTSNQALMWHLLRLAGVPAAGWGPGRLFAEEAGHAAPKEERAHG